MRHFCKKVKVGKHCREWPACKTESEIKLLLQENSKPQDRIGYTDGSATKDQSGWASLSNKVRDYYRPLLS